MGPTGNTILYRPNGATTSGTIIGTAPRLNTTPAFPPSFGDVTIDPKYGGGTITQGQASRVGQLAGNPRNGPYSGESDVEYIKHLIKMAKDNQGFDSQQQDEHDAAQCRLHYPPSIGAAPPGPLGQSPGEWQKEQQKAALEELHREEEAWELAEQLRELGEK